MKNRSLTDFIEAIDNDRPTPGGGAVAPYVGALSTALIRMGGHISFKKEGFLTLPETQKSVLLGHFERLKEIEILLLDLMNEDSSAYQMVMTAIKLPKDDPLRKETIKRTLLLAFDVPYRMTKLLLEAYQLGQLIDPYVEGPLRSDVFVSYAMLKSALIGATVTMKANLTTSTRPELSERWTLIRHEVMNVIDQIDTKIQQEMRDE